MFTALLTSSKPVRFRLFTRRRTGFAVSIPERWSDLKPGERSEWWRLVCHLPAEQVQQALLQKLLRRIPARIRRRMPADDVAALGLALRWARLQPDCSNLPLPEIRLRGTRYVLAKPMGRNVAAGEFAVCDDLYKQVIEKNDLDALRTLTAILYREENPDRAAAEARGDERTPYRNRDEAESRLRRMGEPPAEMQMQALYYFAGLKQVIHRMYGRHIFRTNEDDDTPATGPDFGWWGVLQGAAESGPFEKIPGIYQAFLHEVCVFLVRKKQEADAMQAAHENARNVGKKNDDE